MARVISFIPTQLYQGMAGQEIYSDIFEATDVDNIVLCMILYTYSGTAAANTVQLQTTSDPGFTNSVSWKDVGSSVSLSATGIAGSTALITGLQNFVRAKLTPQNGSLGVFSVVGVARSQQ